MKCPFCGALNTQVVDTREGENGDVMKRRRRCAACDKRFTTFERAELKMPTVVKRNGNRVEFDHDKLASSFRLALRKRPVSADAVDEAIERIEGALLAGSRTEVHTEALGELVMQSLKQLDEVAYIRFASVYRNFTDAAEFTRVIKEVAQPRKRKTRKSTEAADTSATHDLFQQ